MIIVRHLTIALMCSVFLSGCSQHHLNLQQADSSGKYDGVLRFDFSNTQQQQYIGRIRYTCPVETFSRTFIVARGVMYGAEQQEPVGIVSDAGEVHLRERSGSYSSNQIERHAYLLLRDQMDEKFRISTRMTSTYGETTQGCQYDAEGELLLSESDKLAGEKQKANSLTVSWGSKEVPGFYTLQTNTRKNKSPLIFVSEDQQLSCRGWLQLYDSKKTGFWQIRCNDGISAEGNYYLTSHYWWITGEDQAGTSVDAYKGL